MGMHAGKTRMAKMKHSGNDARKMREIDFEKKYFEAKLRTAQKKRAIFTKNTISWKFWDNEINKIAQRLVK